MSLTPDDIRAIVTAFEGSDWSQLSVRHGTTRVDLSRTGQPIAGLDAPPSPAAVAAPAPAPASSPAPVEQPAVSAAHAAPAASPDPAEGEAVLAPTVGLFWRSPQPGAPTFVEVGQRVEADDTVCIVEVMKLMSHVKAGIAGVVVAVPVENGAMVEHGDTLVVIAPEG